MRLTLDLAGRLEESLRALRSGEAKIHEARRQKREARDLSASIERAEAAKERVIEQVQMVIAREAESEGDSCDLLAALDERLNDDIDYIDLDDRPLREAVERICGDLDLKPDWSRWTDDGWPEDPIAVFGARPAWSPFNRPSRKPLLYKNKRLRAAGVRPHRPLALAALSSASGLSHRQSECSARPRRAGA